MGTFYYAAKLQKHMWKDRNDIFLCEVVPPLPNNTHDI